MMWDVVLEDWVALLSNDATLRTLLGGAHIYPAQTSSAVRIPSVEWSLVSDVEEETHNPVVVQVDYWAKVSQAPAIERRIRNLTHRDTARELGGNRMWTRYLESREHEYPADRSVMHRSLDFEFKPLREKYV